MFKNRSLQTRIMSIFIFMSVALTFTLGFIFYGNMVERVKNSKKKEMTTLAIETTNKIERFLFERSADIKVLADSKILTMTEVSDETRKNYLKNVVSAYKTYDEVFVIDNYGDLKITSSEGERDRYYIEIEDQILSEESYISDFIYSEKDEEYSIYFSEILFDDGNSKVGAVVEKMKFDSIMEIIENVKLGNTRALKI